MEVKLRMPDGTVISSHSMKQADATVKIEEIREIAGEVRELIRQSTELDQLEKRLSQVGYAEWVKSGDKVRFYEIMGVLNKGAATAREYWKERRSRHN
ncbi:hypothetical protein [Pseudomonas serbica]|uniref:hypothetical protein n=1 Tax=Pseudomonas serbica TaxID=2965074 RepID=UPI00237BCF38|nr:hypothetical protein [Pseudomonas serbica]